MARIFPQKDFILKSTTFTSKLVLDSFDVPSIVQWYVKKISIGGAVLVVTDT